jgi:hypothetical protein
MHFSIHFYDDRQQYVPTGASFDLATSSYIYHQNLLELFSVSRRKYSSTYSHSYNPFCQKFSDNVTASQAPRIVVNLYPFIRNAIIYGLTSGFLPPKLVDGGVTESDQEYLNHFAISSQNLGYEMPGLSNIETSIFRMQLKHKE